MNDTADIPAEEKSKGGIRRILLPLGLVVIMTGGGFASTFLGFWSPMALFAAKEEHPPEAQAPTVEFVDIPQIVLTLAGPRSRMLIMTVKIETDQAHRAEAEHHHADDALRLDQAAVEECESWRHQQHECCRYQDECCIALIHLEMNLSAGTQGKSVGWSQCRGCGFPPADTVCFASVTRPRSR